ncbi:tRNA splicing endonuclease subunit sen2 [Spiromyces aspiralis]|uniref:tRNA splicing endonuclease subunit sen2 n=1 Tax=Spiromyces aspiralis TaxID=68401 RepID=A0ACC1HQ63_9FUNG|nr:tRNA splicing endonuclease subunit sen2 [Spiromyces aspiralis]
MYPEELTKLRREARHHQRALPPAPARDISNNSSGSNRRPPPQSRPPTLVNSRDLTADQAARMEPMQLSPWEVLFLASELGCLRIVALERGGPASDSITTRELGIHELWRLYYAYYGRRSRVAQAAFIAKYAAYYYYRSKGWVVRSGLKFSADFSIYRHGPKSHHAQYIVSVKPLVAGTDVSALRHAEADETPRYGESHDEGWRLLHSTNRVCGQVKKTLISCYVDVPESIVDNSNSDARRGAPPRLDQISVQEVIVRRYNPAQDRQ